MEAIQKTGLHLNQDISLHNFSKEETLIERQEEVFLVSVICNK